MPFDYELECDYMNVTKRPHPEPLNIPLDDDAHNAIEYTSNAEYGHGSSSKETAAIGRKTIVIRENTEINGNNVTRQTRTCGDAREYQSRDPHSYTASLLKSREQRSIPYTSHPSVPSKHGPLMHDLATKQMTPSAANILTSSTITMLPSEESLFHIQNVVHHETILSAHADHATLCRLNMSTWENVHVCVDIVVHYFGNAKKNVNSANGRTPIYNRCCNGGRVVLRAPPEYPGYIKQLFNDSHFMENIRAYNQIFSMTSLGANIDSSINNGKGLYVFRIPGQIYHWIGSMCPDEGNGPRFLQLYIYDTNNDVSNRMAHFGGEHKSGLKREIVGLIDFLDRHSALVQLFCTARNKYMEGDIPEFKVKLYNVIGTRRYELPTAETIGAIVFGGASSIETEFDLIVEEHSRIPQRVNKLHPCYMSLQFPLLFVYGEEGYQKDMKLINIPGQSTRGEKRLSMNMYYAYQIHDRLNHYNLLTREGRLFQQYVVTAYCAVEQNRLDYIRQNQSDIRNEYLSGIYDAIMRGDRDGNDLGTRIVLTASFTGGPRYMYSHYLDALAICRVHGNPSFFITFTCNAKWPEIQEYMEVFPELTLADRADVVDRVFEQKIRDYVKYVRTTKPFGDITAVLYTIEFQKRRLPHCHSLLWVNASSKIHEDTDVDKYISAELPEPRQDPDGYRIVSELMMHRPCDGFVHYRRRETGIETERQNVRLDSRYVVPYNRMLCARYYAHINVEYCGWTMLIKYMFKYISKGTDRVVANITTSICDTASTNMTPNIHIDEIKNFVEARYIGPHEACWRILEFPIHYRDPPVQILAVHSENMQQIRFRSRDRLQLIVDNPAKKTTLTEWLDYNARKTDGRHLTYLEFPLEYAWHATDKYWQCRRNLNKPSIGRLTYIHPSAGDMFYQRMLLCHRKGCKSFRDIRTVNDEVHPTNRAACKALGLLANPISLRENFWEHMSDEIHRRLSRTLHILDIHKNETKMKATVLFDIESILNSYSKSLKDFGLPMPPKKLLDILQNKFLMEEGNYNREVLEKEKEELIPRLNEDQKLILDEVLNAVTSNEQKLIFVYGHGGTGKTFLWKSITCVLRLEEKIVLTVASSGITESQKQHIQEFARWLLDIGDGNIGDEDETDVENCSTVQMPEDLCIPDFNAAITELINFIYDDQTLQNPVVEDLQTTPHGNDGGESELLYPNEYLNSLKFAGLPPHRLELKVGMPIILLRNLNLTGGLCNGTRLIVTQLLNRVIEAHIITGTRVSEKVFLPRISLINRDLQMPFVFKRRRFPVKVCYAMTINKSQGKSLEKIGVFLPEPVFAHGQLISRFSCTETNKWQQTVDNRTTLNFGRYASIEPIPNDSFPEHYFKFEAYNEVQSEADVKDATLTDYIGCIHQISDPVITGDATRTRSTRRIIDIHRWHQSPVTKRYGGLHLTATPATYYYLNPNIPEVHYILSVYTDFINPIEALEIQRQPCATDEEEQM
nr:DNA helicase [Tanacetum cinerariifolium]